MSRIRVILFATGTQIKEDEIQTVASSIEMLDSTGEAIPFDTEVEREAAGIRGPGRTRVFINLIAKGALHPGWNAVRVTSIPLGWKLMDLTWAPASEGASEVRGRVATGDFPVVRSVEFCWSVEKQFVQIEFSQNVQPEALNATLSVSVDGSKCNAVGLGEQAPTAIDFSCSGAEPKSIRIALNGLRSAEGADVRFSESLPQDSTTLMVESFKPHLAEGENCYIYRF